MNDNQINPQPGYQQNQPLADNLADNQTLPGNYEAEYSENSNTDSQKELPERNQQHNYKNPSAYYNEDEEDIDEDELNSNGEVFDQDYENNSNLFDEELTDVK